MKRRPAKKIYMIRYISLVTVLLFVVACSSSDKTIDDRLLSQPEDIPVEVLYNEAAQALDQGNHSRAAKLFTEVERIYPFSQWAVQAQLMSAFAYYQDQRYDEAIVALDRFIKLHPGHKNIDYAHYLKAISFYEQISDVRRDQSMTELALRNLDVVISRFPDSQYARDARLKRDLTFDHLAGKEMEIGRFYLQQKEFNAALNRFRSVVTTYQTTMHVPEALHRMVETYLALGIRAEATRVAAVLGYNYPGSRWYQDTYNLLDDKQRRKLSAQEGWFTKTVDEFFSSDAE